MEKCKKWQIVFGTLMLGGIKIADFVSWDRPMLLKIVKVLNRELPDGQPRPRKKVK